MCQVVTASVDGYVTSKYGDPGKKWVSFALLVWTLDAMTERIGRVTSCQQ